MSRNDPKDSLELERIVRQNLESSCVDYVADFGEEEVRKIIDTVLEQWKRENEGEEFRTSVDGQ